MAKAHRLLHAICNTEVAEQKIPTLDQVYALAEAVGGRWRALLMGTFCGLRFGELGGLTRVDVDLELAVVVVGADLDELHGGRLQPGEVK